MAIDMDQTFNRDEMQRKRQRAVLITIDYDGQSFRGDGKLYRGRAVAVHAPTNFGYASMRNKVVQIDREISGEMFQHGRMPVEEMKNREFSYMEQQLLQASRKLSASGPECALIPVYEYQNMARKITELQASLHQQKAENLHLAHRNMLVRNHALRWKATAAKLMRQRDDTLLRITRRKISALLRTMRRKTA